MNAVWLTCMSNNNTINVYGDSYKIAEYLYFMTIGK